MRYAIAGIYICYNDNYLIGVYVRFWINEGGWGEEGFCRSLLKERKARKEGRKGWGLLVKINILAFKTVSINKSYLRSKIRNQYLGNCGI